MNTTERINDGASTSTAGAVEILQVDDEIDSMLTPYCVGIDWVRSSLMKTHWAAASSRFTTTFFNNSFGHKCDVCYRLWFLLSLKSTKERHTLTAAPLLNNTFPEEYYHDCHSCRYVCCDAIDVPVDVNTMVQQLPHQLGDDQAFNVNIRNIIRKSTYLSGQWEKLGYNSYLGNHCISITRSQYIGIHFMLTQKPVVWQPTPSLMIRLSIYSVEDSMPVSVLGFYLRSYCNTAKRRQIATTSSVEISSSSNHKAGGVAIYRNINSFTDCNRVNIDISENNLGMKDAKAGDVYLVNEKVNGIFKLILGCVYIHPGTVLTEIKLFMLLLLLNI
ncbi:uncharacterized protein TNCV_2692441 [Trichonephila clavipes]|uniref:Uncharacterized protein n=1 Tax=Trichonephila clavipes TaxID=2585209 RepID=A0A8X7BAR1_TRICX|nr:uncharacterized protein TNCV_2692441 [Trichonephila clavipes]